MTRPSPPRDAAAPSVCAVVPSFNNEGAVGDVVARLVAQGLPVLLVDDGCTDRTAERASAAGAEVVAHPHNRGKGAALLTGWAAAAERGFTHALCLDADGQHRPEDAPAFLAALQADPDALVVGCRQMDGEHVPRSSRIGRAISDFMLWASSAKELGGERPDSQCGYRLYPLKHVLQLPLKARHYQLEMEVLVRAAWQNVPLRAIPIDVHYPPPSERVSHFDKWADNGRIVRVYTRLMLIRLIWPITRPRRPLLPPR
jgi:glycosyltransferase involved in cell wall biosynthesis